MKKKVTIYDVSKKLGVSTATVNRALNDKPKVSKDTREMVLKAAEEMGYTPSRTASSLSRTPVNIGVVISCSINEFHDEIVSGAKYALQEFYDFNLRGEVITIPEADPIKEYCDKLRRFAAKGFNGIICLPHSDERNMKFLFDDLVEKGLKVATVTSDISDCQRLFSVRNNGYVAGKMAAELLHYMVEPGKPVALVTGCRDTIVHGETIKGFREYTEKYNMNDVGVYEHRDDPNIAYYLANKIISDYPNLGGVYLGSANSVTFCKRLCELGVDQQVKIIASDVFPAMVDMINTNIVNATIFQHPFDQARLAVQYMFEYLAEGKKLQNDTKLLDPQVILKSNIELYSGSTPKDN
jgi:LacI family transcriptional regulator